MTILALPHTMSAEDFGELGVQPLANLSASRTIPDDSR
jgi:hypothetical protein